MCHSAFRPYRYFGHAINLVLGKYSLKDDPGSIPHSQALSTALSGTLGLGNIAGVAIAISVGGPVTILDVGHCNRWCIYKILYYYSQ